MTLVSPLMPLTPVAKQNRRTLVGHVARARNHISFASAHPGTKPFETIKLPTATRSCGRTIVCRGQARLTFPKIFPFRRPNSLCVRDIIGYGQLFGLLRG